MDASYRGPTWQRWVFKPLTLLLLLLLAWQAPMFDAISYPVLAGLCASLLGDALTLSPRQRLMYAIGAFSSRTCCTPSISPVR
ncbi:lysoplasmalogenase family protein [Shigella flexneri]